MAARFSGKSFSPSRGGRSSGFEPPSRDSEPTCRRESPTARWARRLAALAPFVLASCSAITSGCQGASPRVFRVWFFSDAHVGSDRRQGRESLAEALRQSESGSGFAWDIALDLGDMSGAESTPQDQE